MAASSTPRSVEAVVAGGEPAIHAQGVITPTAPELIARSPDVAEVAATPATPAAGVGGGLDEATGGAAAGALGALEVPDDSQGAYLAGRGTRATRKRRAPGAEAASLAIVPADVPAPDTTGTLVPAPAAQAQATRWQGVCWFECGETSDTCDLTYWGNKASRKWCCNQCNAARRMLDGRARALGKEVQATLAIMKKSQQGDYKAKVRDARLLDPRERNARRTAVTAILSKVMVGKELREVTGVVWLNKAEFVGHCVSVLGQSRAEGEAAWLSEVRDPARAKRGQGDTLRMAVQLPPRTEASSSIAVSREVTREAHVGLTGPDATLRLGQLQACIVPGALPAFSEDTFAAIDRSGLQYGAASSSCGTADPLAQLTAANVGATSLKEVAEQSPQMAAILAPPPPTAIRRPLQAAPSDPDAVVAASKREESLAARTFTL